MIIITDILNDPFDEGAKNAISNLVKCIKGINSAFVFSVNSKHNLSFIDSHICLNKLLFNVSFYKSIREHNSAVLYIPEASITFFSFIRAKLLHLFTGSDIYVLSLQPRTYGFFAKNIIKIIPPCCVITQSQNTAKYLSDLGIKSQILPLGVDNDKYYQFDPGKKKELRVKYGIDDRKTVLLHVGHIQKSRNLDWFISIKKDNPGIEIIIVGSTFNKDDDELHNTLHKSKIKIIRKYTPNMEEFYNIANYYVFPVLQNDGAIETPLSVLEAMACNLPIITTRFGSLPDTFSADQDFHYVESADEIIQIVKGKRLLSCKNREKIKQFTWKEIAKKLVDIVEH